MTRQRKIDRNLLLAFLSVPMLSSIMSAIHLINMVELGNPFFMAVVLAVTFELGSIVSFVALSKNILKRLKKDILYIIFGMLFVLQAFGNVYSSFDYIRVMLLSDPTWLDSFREMFFNAMDVPTSKLLLSCIIGLPIPIISLAFLKSAIDYFSFDGTDAEPADAPDKPKREEIVNDMLTRMYAGEPAAEKKTEVKPEEPSESAADDEPVFKSPGVYTIEPPPFETPDEPVLENEPVSQPVEEIAPEEPEQAQIEEPAVQVIQQVEEIASEEPKQEEQPATVEPEKPEEPKQEEPVIMVQRPSQGVPTPAATVRVQPAPMEKKSS